MLMRRSKSKFLFLVYNFSLSSRSAVSRAVSPAENISAGPRLEMD